MPSIDTPLLIIGPGPAALVAAKSVSGRGLPCLVAGHVPVDDHQPVVLDAKSLAILEPHGVLDVLRPYASTQDPFTIAPLPFEQGLKHHCVADMLVTVYDNMTVEDRSPDGAGINGVLTDGRARWAIHADAFVDTSTMPADLNEAIHQAAELANLVLARLRAR